MTWRTSLENDAEVCHFVIENRDASEDKTYQINVVHILLSM